MYNPRQTSRLRQPINPRLPHELNFNSNSTSSLLFQTPQPTQIHQNGRTLRSKSPSPTGPPKRRPNLPRRTIQMRRYTLLPPPTPSYLGSRKGKKKSNNFRLGFKSSHPRRHQRCCIRRHSEFHVRCFRLI